MTDRLRTPLMFVCFCAATAGGGISPAARATEVMPVQVSSAAEIAPLAPQGTVQVTTATATGSQLYQPAPMPNPDIDPPHGDAAPRGASITPALFSHKAEFQGDGYSAASNVDHGLDERRTPAAGLNWSVPVK